MNAPGPLPRRRDGVALRRLDGGDAEITDAGGAVLGRVNAIGAAAFELCDGATTVAEMAQAAADVFAVDASRAEAQLADAVAALVALGAVVEA